MYDDSQSNIKYDTQHDTQYDGRHPDATIARPLSASAGSTPIPAVADEGGLLGPSLCRRRQRPVPTPFTYADSDEEDFRGHFDFGEAWAGASCANISSCSYSTPSGSASLGIPSPGPNGWSPRADQEYDDIMYKLDLGAESPYLRTAYAELSFPPSRRAGGGGGGVPEMIVEVDEAEEGEEEIEPARNYADVDCRMCLKKAVSRTRTRCCNTVFCRAHIDEWLKREESKGLCPMCDKPCVLARAPPPPPLLSVSTCRSSISSMSSSTSTTSTLVEEGLWETEAEDTWDVKGAWKNDGGSLDVKGMVRDVVGESLQFMGLVWVGHRKESSGATTRLASVVGLVLVLFVLLR